MALALNNYVTVGVNAGSSPVGIYTAPSGYNAVVLCAQATNTTGASEDITLQHVREVSGVAVTTYASYQKACASHETIELTTGKLTLVPGDQFKVGTSTSTGLHVLVTVLETLI